MVERRARDLTNPGYRRPLYRHWKVADGKAEGLRPQHPNARTPRHDPTVGDTIADQVGNGWRAKMKWAMDYVLAHDAPPSEDGSMAWL